MKQVSTGKLTSDGAALAAGNRFRLAFDQIKNLSSIVASLPAFKENADIQSYRTLILKAEIQIKKGNTEVINVFNHPYSAMLKQEDFIPRIMEGDLTWIREHTIIVSKKGTNASIPLSKVYEWSMINDTKVFNDIECTLLLIFKHLASPETEMGRALVEICKDFKLSEKEVESNKAVGNIVKKVKQNIPKGNGAAPQTEDVIKIVQAIVGGGDDGDMGNLAQGIMSGQVTIPQLVEQVKAAVQGEGDDEAEGDGEETQ